MTGVYKTAIPKNEPVTARLPAGFSAGQVHWGALKELSGMQGDRFMWGCDYIPPVFPTRDHCCSFLASAMQEVSNWPNIAVDLTLKKTRSAGETSKIFCLLQ